MSPRMPDRRVLGAEDSEDAKAADVKPSPTEVLWAAEKDAAVARILAIIWGHDDPPGWWLYAQGRWRTSNFGERDDGVVFRAGK